VIPERLFLLFLRARSLAAAVPNNNATCLFLDAHDANYHQKKDRERKSTRSVLHERNRARINIERLRFRARLARPESNDLCVVGLRYLLRHKLARGTESESPNFIRGRARDLYVSSGLSIAIAATAYSTSDV